MLTYIRTSTNILSITTLSVPTVDYTAHYCGQLFVGFCYNFLGSLQKKSIITFVLHFGGNQNAYENSMICHYSKIIAKIISLPLLKHMRRDSPVTLGGLSGDSRATLGQLSGDSQATLG